MEQQKNMDLPKGGSSQYKSEMVVSTHLKKYARQIGSCPQVGVKIKNISNHHLEMMRSSLLKWLYGCLANIKINEDQTSAWMVCKCHFKHNIPLHRVCYASTSWKHISRIYLGASKSSFPSNITNWNTPQLLSISA